MKLTGVASYSPNKPSLQTPLPLIFPPKTPGTEEDGVHVSAGSHHSQADSQLAEVINGEQGQKAGHNTRPKSNPLHTPQNWDQE